jgi:hypothetical protein
MYGMTSRAIEDLIRDSYGDETWDMVRAEAGVDLDPFVHQDSHPEESTYQLLGAASRVLGLEPVVVLEALGEHWVLCARRHGYDTLFDDIGSGFGEVVQNLRTFHTRARAVFPDLQPPVFRCTEVHGCSLRLHYYSHLPGLAPMVAGMLRGLGRLFSARVAAKLIRSRADGEDHDVFVVNWELIGEHTDRAA